MQLKYIEIQGFKSFPDKTRITFEQGYTGIVGPNGSGKSNISDAVRWVLGEQSSKSLRGDRMEDVIFAGTELRRPMGFAQVSLCLDNGDGRIPDVGDELTVSRRYYRSGDSEYLINGNAVRLRDVREMFMDTGLGRDGYSIIGQNRITEIVSSKSADRREIFEEASGIARYRFRKNEASRRLEAAEDNLSRLRDILDELESRIEPLTKQSEKAQEFLTLSEERRSLEITLYCDTIDRARESLREQADRIGVAGANYRAVQERIDGLSARIEELYDSNRRRNAEIEGMTAEIETLQQRAADTDSEAAVTENDITHGDERIAALEGEIATLSGDGASLVDEIEKREQHIADLKEQVAGLDGVLASLEQELAELDRSSEATGKTREDTVRRLAELQGEITDLRVARVAAEAENRAGEERAAAILALIPDWQQRLRAASEERDADADEFKKLSDAITDLENRRVGFQMKLDSRREKQEGAAAALETKRREAAELSDRAGVLRDMERTMDGYLPSVRRVAEAANERRLRGIIGTVASLIEVKSGCELAVETALGAAAQNIIVEDERAARDAIAFLKDTRAGRATFLPLDTIKPSRFEYRERLSDEGVVGLASELVSCDSRYRDIISSLLGRIVVTDDLNTASAVAKRVGYRCRLVTTDGQVINAGGSYTGGFTSSRAGFFSRRTEIEKLEARAAEAKKQADEAAAAYDALAREVSGLEAELTAIGSDLVNLGGDRIRVEGELARLHSAIDTLTESIDAANDELKSIEQGRAERQRAIETGGERTALLTGEAERLERAVADGDTSAEAFMRRRAELSEHIAKRRIERVERQKDMENAAFEIESLRRRGGDAEGRVRELRAAIAETRGANDMRRKRVAELRARAESLRGEAVRRRGSIENAGAARGEADRAITEARREQDELVEQRQLLASEQARLEERRDTLEREYQSTVSRLWEEYELTKEEAAALCVPFASLTELRGRVTGLRGRIRALGSVNVGAIEELKEVTERFRFMTEQVEDVERSRAELLKLISGLESEMKTIFTASFNAINENFVRVFSELFGGGNARLFLTDEEDVLGSGIEIEAQPPGKVINNLAALSGGEQSLLAIAIYFAILAVNPSPFCILDEIDSALDEANVGRFAGYLGRVCDNTQIIAITHRRGTMEGAGVLYGVTMQEEGVSRLLKLDVEEAQLVIQ